MRKYCISVAFLFIFCTFITFAVANELSEWDAYGDEMDAGIQDEKLVLTLQECLDIALLHNHLRPVSKLAVEIAEAQHRQALSSWWPQVKVASMYSQLDEDPVFIFPSETIKTETTARVRAYDGGPFVTTTWAENTSRVSEKKVKIMDKENLLYGANVMYPLYTGGKRSAITRQAQYGIEAAKEEVRFTDLEITYKVKKMYYATVLAKKLYALGKEALERLEATLELTERLYKEGSGSVKKTDYLSNKIIVGALRSSVSFLKSNQQLAKSALINTMGLEWDTELELAENDIPYNPYEVDLESLVSDAYLFNPDWVKLGIGLKVAEEKIREAKSGYFPNIALTGSINWIENSHSAGTVSGTNQNIWMAGVGCEIPIFDGFLTVNKVREARARLEQLKEQEFLLQEGIALQVKKIFIDMIRSQDQEKAMKEAREAAQENRDLNVRAYQEALVETEEVIKSQLIESFIKAQYQKALYDHVESQANLDFVIGKEVSQMFLADNNL